MLRGVHVFGYILLGLVACLQAPEVLAFSQFPDEPTVAALRGNAKLLDENEIMSPFRTGDAKSAVIVLLQPSPAGIALAARSPASTSAPTEFKALVPPLHVDLRDRSIRRELQAAVNAAVAEVLDRHSGAGLESARSFSYQFGFAARVTTAALSALVNDPAVAAVEPDRLLSPHLAQGIPLMNGAVPRTEYDGAGLSIAICDTGIDSSHPQLGGGGFPNDKVIGGYDFGMYDPDPRPSGNAHGTACAGLAAGSADSIGDYIGGVAPGARLYSLKISNDTDHSATGSAMVMAWEWAITHQDDDPAHPIKIISTSFGGGKRTALCDSYSPSMTSAAANAVKAGIAIFCSAGNDGYCNATAWPACISHVNSVGAVYDSNFGTYSPCIDSSSCAPTKTAGGCSSGYYAIDDTRPDAVASYSNSATFLTMFAPANQAYTTDLAGGAGYSAGDYESAFGGTSAAAPYAAGAAAILQEAAKRRTGLYLTPAQVRQYLVDYGDSVTDAKVAVTRPRINLADAVDALPITLYVRIIGRGRVGSVPAGISCGADCSHAYAAGDVVQLAASTAPGESFLGWSGEGCSGTDTCSVTMDRARRVTATFSGFPWVLMLPVISGD